MSSHHFVIAPVPSVSLIPGEYQPSTLNSSFFPDEAWILKELVSILTEQGLESLSIRSEKLLLQNLRSQLERLNRYTFSDYEWKRFRDVCLCAWGEGTEQKVERLQTSSLIKFRQENGNVRNICLFDRTKLANNRFQFFIPSENLNVVTILLNGLPVIQIELYPSTFSLSEAFEQDTAEEKEPIWDLNRLFEYTQIFVVSNGRETRYCTAEERRRNNVEESQYWTDLSGTRISDLLDFSRTFLIPNKLLKFLSRYCARQLNGKMAVLRPYQIAASEQILSRIAGFAENKKRSVIPGGCIHHAHGTGNTVTAFWISQLASREKRAEKIIYVTDCEGLNWQKIRSFEYWEKGAVNFDENVQLLRDGLKDSGKRLLLTTIQKLMVFLKSLNDFEVIRKRVVFLFDECQSHLTEKMRSLLVKNFPDSRLFFFTGAKTFEVPSSFSGGVLHTYTLSRAISNQNVLPFQVDYVNTIPCLEKEEIPEISAIRLRKHLISPDRIHKISRFILENAQGKTQNGRFGAILVVDDVVSAMNYYVELRREAGISDWAMKIAMIYGPGVSGELVEPDEKAVVGGADRLRRDFMELAVEDYNALFNTSLSSMRERFQEYFLDLSRRMYERGIELLIITKSFASSFNLPGVNTLWLDSELSPNAILQAFAITNSKSDPGKYAGNVICFRNMRGAVEETLATDGNGTILREFSYDLI